MINISIKAQSWSIDVILGVLVFMAAFFVFYAVLNTDQGAKVGDLKRDASVIVKEISSGDSLLSIVDGNEINVSKVNDLKNLSYGELKRRLRIENDFCLYFEDDKGYIVIINNSYKGVGASSINLSGTPCSQK